MAWYSGCARITSTATASMPTSGWPAWYLRQAPKNVSRTWSRVGSNTSGLGLLPVLAQVADQAFRTPRLARDAHVAPVQDQPVMRVLQEFGRRELDQPVFHLARVVARGEVGAVGDAEDMRIDCHGRLAERRVEHHIRGLAPDPGQRLQLVTRRRHLAAVFLDQQARKLDHILRLVAIEADGLDVALESGDAELRHLFRRLVLLEERCGRQVD